MNINQVGRVIVCINLEFNCLGKYRDFIIYKISYMLCNICKLGDENIEMNKLRIYKLYISSMHRFYLNLTI